LDCLPGFGYFAAYRYNILVTVQTYLGEVNQPVGLLPDDHFIRYLDQNFPNEGSLRVNRISGIDFGKRDGDWHRWVAAEPRRNGFDLWGYQDDTPKILYLGSGAHEEQLEKLADQFLLSDPEIINFSFFSKALPA